MQVSKPKGVQIMSQQAAAALSAQKGTALLPSTPMHEWGSSDKPACARNAQTYQSNGEWT